MSNKSRPIRNDHRSNTRKPNSHSHKAARDNRAAQKNPNHAPGKGGRRGGGGK
jgi:hypothetical protein